MKAVIEMRNTPGNVAQTLLAALVFTSMPVFAETPATEIETVKTMTATLVPPATPVTKDELVSILELQYQITLDLPYAPSTDATLAGLDMAISGARTATPEAMDVLQEVTPHLRILHTHLQDLDASIQAQNSDTNSMSVQNLVSPAAQFDCDGYIELAGELERPPGPCNQSDSQVRGVPYFTDGSNDRIFLSDNVYPKYPFCNANIPPETIRNLQIAALVAEQIKFLADRACKQALFFFASGGNAELVCIATDILNTAAWALLDERKFCNNIRSASEGRTSYVRSGELFVQNSENTQYVDQRLINGFDDLNGDIGAIKDQACDNAIRLNQQIEQLNETLRAIRIENARLLDLFGDQLDPIDPVPIPSPKCVPPVVAVPDQSNNPALPAPPSVTPPSTSQPTRPLYELALPDSRRTNTGRARK